MQQEGQGCEVYESWIYV